MDNLGREYLSEHEVKALEEFASNQVLVEAVKKVLLEGVYYQGTMEQGKAPDASKNFLLAIATQQLELTTNEVLGDKIRAAVMGVTAVEQGFNAIKQYKKQVEKTKKDKVNEAR